MSTPTLDAWQRLGNLLLERRAKLDPAFRNRRTFAERTRLDYRVLFDLEKAKRTNFGPETLAAVEAAYRLPAGSIQRALAGEDLPPLPEPAHEARREAFQIPEGVELPPGFDPSSVEPAVLHLLLTPDAKDGRVTPLRVRQTLANMWLIAMGLNASDDAAAGAVAHGGDRLTAN